MSPKEWEPTILEAAPPSTAVPIGTQPLATPVPTVTHDGLPWPSLTQQVSSRWLDLMILEVFSNLNDSTILPAGWRVLIPHSKHPARPSS